MRYYRFALAVCLLGVTLAGCSPTPTVVSAGSPPAPLSPLNGKWEGKSDMKDKGLGTFENSLAGGPLTGPSSMTLNPDGTGFLKVADQSERPITWKQEGEKLLVEGRNIIKESKEGAGTESDSKTYVGTLSSDKRTVVLDLDAVKVTLNKQTGESGG